MEIDLFLFIFQFLDFYIPEINWRSGVFPLQPNESMGWKLVERITQPFRNFASVRVFGGACPQIHIHFSHYFTVQSNLNLFPFA